MQLFLVFLISTFIALVNSHGFVTGPFPSRNSVQTHYCRQCANGRGPCGEGGQWGADSSVLDLQSKYTTPLSLIKGGDVIELSLHLSQAHQGHYVLELCRPTGSRITEDCFQRRLMRDPTDERYSPFVKEKPTIAIFQSNSCAMLEEQKVRFIVPKDFGDCEHCILRWFWQTGNSCSSDPFTSSSTTSEHVRSWSSINNCYVGLSSLNSCGSECPHSKCVNEQFRNCMDVKISSSGNPPPVPTGSPTNPTTKPNQTLKPNQTTKPKPTTKPPVPASTTKANLTGGVNGCCVNPVYAHQSGMQEWCRMNGCSPATHCLKC